MDPSLSGKASEYVERLRATTAGYSYAELERTTAVSESQLRDTVRLLVKAERAVLIAGEALARSKDGPLDLMNLYDLAILTGRMEREGCGVNVLCQAANEQGVVEMGAAPEYLPGLKDAKDPEIVHQFVSAWKDELAMDGGCSLLEMIEKAKKGEIKALYLIGVDPLSIFPDSVGVREALSRLDLLVCQDLFLTATGRLSHLVLPACSFAEKDGTFTNQEGRVQKVNKAIEPVGESKSDWEIFSEISRELNYPLEYADAQEIFSEISTLIPFYRRRLAADVQKKERQVYVEKYLSGGYLQDFEPRYQKDRGVMNADRAYPFTLVLGSMLFHSGGLSHRSDARLQINPNDAAALSVQEGQRIWVCSPRGRVEVKVSPNPKIPEKTLYFPEPFARFGMKELFAVETVPLSRVPYFKATNVALERI